MVIQRRVSARDRFQAVVEIKDDFVQRQFVIQHHARGAYIFECLLASALFFHQLEDAANIFFVREDGRHNHRLFDFRDLTLRRPFRRIINVDHLRVSKRDLVTHARGGGNEVKIELTLQPLLNDFHVEQAEEAAAEAESKRHRAFRLEEKRRIIEP